MPAQIISFLHRITLFEQAWLSRRPIKIISLILVLLVYIVLIGRHINPFDPGMFDFHDETQPARIMVFAENLALGQIPPRVGTEMSWNLSFPVFNYYAPTPYWISSMFFLFTQDAVLALKWSFVTALLTMLITMFLLLRPYFGWYPALLGGIVWATSPYTAVQIVIRGNLGEVWWMALFPLGLFVFIRLFQNPTVVRFVIACIVLSLVFTVHNLFSVLSLGIFLVLGLLLSRRIVLIASIVTGLFLGAYFLIPAILELGYVQARDLAVLYDYKNHFLCLHQVWQMAAWNIGVSLAGCEDTMPFIIGKGPIILGVTGLLVFIIFVVWKLRKQSFQLLMIKKRLVQLQYPSHSLYLFLSLTGLLGITSLFMTLQESKLIWILFEPFLEIYQFPWRFLTLTLFALAVFTGYLFFQFKQKLPVLAICVLTCFALVAINQKYFIKPMYDPEEYRDFFASRAYVLIQSAYNFREYLTVKADYDVWYSHHPIWGENTFSPRKNPFELPDDSTTGVDIITDEQMYEAFIVNSADTITINKHYIPNWIITIDGQEVIPTEFDDFGRPVFTVDAGTEVTVFYRQTFIQQLSNFISVAFAVGLIVLLYLSKYGKLGAIIHSKIK